jgi:hypothetical protein
MFVLRRTRCATSTNISRSILYGLRKSKLEKFRLSDRDFQSVGGISSGGRHPD